MNWFWLKACAKCGGDLAVDEGDWICLQCGTYCYTGLYLHGWVRSPSHTSGEPGESGHQGLVRQAHIFGPLKKSGQEAPRLLAPN